MIIKLDFRSEMDRIKNSYDKRKLLPKNFYSSHNIEVMRWREEKKNTIIKIFKKLHFVDLTGLKILEIGCGIGNNIKLFIEMGFSPENITGNDLLEERIEEAKKSLPSQVTLIHGNALELEFFEQKYDIVFQSLVFSSILDSAFKKKLSTKMINCVSSKGGILWYDFAYNNPWNKDVKGIKIKEVKQLFNENVVYKYRLTLLPPLARRIVKIHPILYSIFNFFPFLRTHLLIWIKTKNI